MKDTAIYPKRTLNIKGILHSFDQPVVVGILNITPDSFFETSRVSDWEEIEVRISKLISEGLKILDVGGYSSRPGADDVSEEEELRRIVPVISKIAANYPQLLISVDTFRSRVAEEAIRAGASIVNDISGGLLDKSMFEVVAKAKVPYILMHMRGTPQTMQQMTDYSDLIHEMLFYFSERVQIARKAGIADIILDPGFGFSKTVEQNFEILKHLHHFSLLGCPVLVGFSRKSMIQKSLGVSAEESLNGTTVLNTLALTKGADFLRVHDVREAQEAIKLFALATA